MIQEIVQKLYAMGANITIFSMRSARFWAIIKFRDKIYTPAPALPR